MTTKRKWDHKPDQLRNFPPGYELIRLHVPDAKDAKGRSIGKAPYKGWRQDDPLTQAEAAQCMAEGYNVGVRMRPEDLVVDVDPRNFPEGTDPFKQLQDDLGVRLTDYPTVVTGSGGLHIYMRKPADEMLRDSLEAYQGVEFKTLGRQLVAAGSVHPDTGRPYLWDDLSPPLSEVRDAPRELIELTRRPGRIAAVDAGSRSPEELGEMLEGLDAREFSDQTKWLELMMACHHATGGEGRDEWIEWSTSDPTYAGDAWIIGRRWDSLHADTSGRRVTEKTLFKALHAAGRGELIPRISAAEDFGTEPSDRVFDEAKVTETEEELQELIDQYGDDPNVGTGPLEAMNARGYAAVNENGSFRIYRRKMDYTWPDEPREMWEVQKKGDFLDILSNVRIQKTKGDTVTSIPLAQEWLKWGGRTTFDGVVFDPACRVPTSAKMLNLWTDWAVEPKKGDWSILKRLLLEGLCDGNEEMYEYVLNWSAFMVQNPDKPAEVAIVFKGQKGTGKGTYFRALGRLAGKHSMQISSQHHFTNHFNAHLRDCIFLFADEAIWAGDKKAEGELKRLITEPTLLFEAKGKDAVPGRNHLHVVMASNEDWVVPASFEERRFSVSEVNPKFRGDREFFDALNKQLDEEGGLEALLWDLKTRNIEGFHPRSSIPQTKALAQQKLQSLDMIDSFWYNCLSTGMVSQSEDSVLLPWDRPADADEDGEGVTGWFCQDVTEAFEDHARKMGDRFFGRRSLGTTLGLRLKRYVPSMMKRRVRCPESRPDLMTKGNDPRTYIYTMPSLAECRKAFEDMLGTSLDWTPMMGDDIDVDLDADVQDMDL